MWKKLRGTELDEYRTGYNLIIYSPRSFLSHANAHYFLAYPRTLQKIKKNGNILKKIVNTFSYIPEHTQVEANVRKCKRKFRKLT